MGINDDNGERSRISEEDVISPREALDSIASYVGSEYQAKQVIADALHSDKVFSVAELIWMANKGDVRDDWEPITDGENFLGSMCDIVPGTFKESNAWPADITFWNWETGDFLVLLTDPEFDTEAVRIHIKGIKFLRKDILSLVGRSNRKGVGGKKPDRERWAEFWVSILYGATASTFDWTQFANPNQLKARLLEWSDDEFSESYLDSTINIVWEQLVKRCARERKHGLS